MICSHDGGYPKKYIGHGYDFRDELIPIAVEMFKGLRRGRKRQKEGAGN